MKAIGILFALMLVSVISAKAEEPFVPRWNVDHKRYIDEALHYLLKERPDLKEDNLEFRTINYQFQWMPDTTVECGPNGCVVKPAAPFEERLSVCFEIKDSKRQIVEDGRPYIMHDTVDVQFPTPRMNEWMINKGTSQYAVQVPPEH